MYSLRKLSTSVHPCFGIRFSFLSLPLKTTLLLLSHFCDCLNRQPSLFADFPELADTFARAARSECDLRCSLNFISFRMFALPRSTFISGLLVIQCLPYLISPTIIVCRNASPCCSSKSLNSSMTVFIGKTKSCPMIRYLDFLFWSCALDSSERRLTSSTSELWMFLQSVRHGGTSKFACRTVIRH